MQPNLHHSKFYVLVFESSVVYLRLELYFLVNLFSWIYWIITGLGMLETKFEHSVKVPRQYKTAAKILKAVKQDGGSLKSLVYEKKHERVSELYSLLAKAIQNSAVIKDLVGKSKILEKETRFDPFLLDILITQLLWGRKKLVSGAKPIQIVLSYEDKLRELASSQDKEPIKELKVNIPRYIRVNTLKLGVNEVLEELRDGGWTLQKFLQKDDYEGFLSKVNELDEYDFLLDLHFPDLLVFNKGVKFFQWKSHEEKGIILQDKASCLPTFLLNPPPGSTVLDMCAAPGMKTLHLAALMENKGKIYATELNPNRFKSMKENFETSGGTCIESICKDILAVKKEEVPGVEYILVDPSCSGTGMVKRHELFKNNPEEEAARIKKLKGFQILILKHAIRSFPDAKRIVYSTCSLEPEENEAVVQEIISQSYFYRLANARDYLKAPWVNFGAKEYGVLGERCLYSKPEKDLCNGFFVAIFERLQEGETNDLLTKPQKKNNFKFGKKRKETEIKEVGNIDESPKKKQKNTAENSNDRLKSANNQDSIGNNDEVVSPSKKKKNKSKKAAEENSAVHRVENEDKQVDTNEVSSKKKKNKLNKVAEENSVAENEDKQVDNNEVSSKKKKNKSEKIAEENSVVENEDKQIDNNEVSSKKKKNKSKKVAEENSVVENEDKQVDKNEVSSKKKKNKSKKVDSAINLSEEKDVAMLVENNDSISPSKKKNKKKNKSKQINQEISAEISNENVEINKKHKLETTEGTTNESPKKSKKKKHNE